MLYNYINTVRLIGEYRKGILRTDITNEQRLKWIKRIDELTEELNYYDG